MASSNVTAAMNLHRKKILFPVPALIARCKFDLHTCLKFGRHVFVTVPKATVRENESVVFGLNGYVVRAISASTENRLTYYMQYTG